MLRWKKILVATDFSPSSRVTTRSAIGLAGQMGATLQVIHVVERLPRRHRLLLGSFGDAGSQGKRVRRAEAHLARALGRIRAPGLALEGEVRYGRAWEEILEAIREVEAELVCIGNSGHSRLQRLTLGSTAENVVRRSPVPVLVTRRRPLGRIARAFLPVDFSEGAAAAACFAAHRLPAGVQLHALYVVPPPPPMPEFFAYPVDPLVLKGEIRSFLAEAGIRKAVVEVALFEDPTTAILGRALRQRADVILISTHGRSGLARLMLGSVAEKVIRHAQPPVLVLPGPRAATRAARPRRSAVRTDAFRAA